MYAFNCMSGCLCIFENLKNIKRRKKNKKKNKNLPTNQTHDATNFGITNKIKSSVHMLVWKQFKSFRPDLNNPYCC